jgi:hypothetical protein
MIVNADLRSAEVIRRVRGIDYPSVAEIGVYEGDMSRRLLYRLNLHLLMVDPWGTIESSDDDKYRAQSDEDWEAVMNKALSGVSWAADRVRVFHGSSKDAAETFDEKFDLVFIDGDHGYDAVSSDIEYWWPKIAEGGWLGGHDYRTDMDIGVIEAVNDWADENIIQIELGENYTWWARK